MTPSTQTIASTSLSELQLMVDVTFPIISGKVIPADHGYALLSSITRYIPSIKEHTDISILTASGLRDGTGKIVLAEYSRFLFRLPVSKIPLVYSLAGETLKLGIHAIRLGIPSINPLKVCSKLRSRIVTIKGYDQPDAFLEAVRRQLEGLTIRGEVSLPHNARKTIKIKRFSVVGFTVEVRNLSEEDSLKLQAYGLGGKRHMGCGIFLPF
ncbi:MAG: type I-MYXAN CRISPR-associated protein Cas6/Cmx6 [Pseudanabaenaceae cyanobacterium]